MGEQRDRWTGPAPDAIDRPTPMPGSGPSADVDADDVKVFRRSPTWPQPAGTMRNPSEDERVVDAEPIGGVRYSDGAGPDRDEIVS